MWKILLRLPLVAGISLTIGGFIYDVAAVNVPPQDPTPEVARSYGEKLRTAERVRAAGMALAGASAAVIVGARQWERRRRLRDALVERRPRS